MARRLLFLRLVLEPRQQTRAVQHFARAVSKCHMFRVADREAFGREGDEGPLVSHGFDVDRSREGESCPGAGLDTSPTRRMALSERA